MYVYIISVVPPKELHLVQRSLTTKWNEKKSMEVFLDWQKRAIEIRLRFKDGAHKVLNKGKVWDYVLRWDAPVCVYGQTCPITKKYLIGTSIYIQVSEWWCLDLMSCHVMAGSSVKSHDGFPEVVVLLVVAGEFDWTSFSRKNLARYLHSLVMWPKRL